MEFPLKDWAHSSLTRAKEVYELEQEKIQSEKLRSAKVLRNAEPVLLAMTLHTAVDYLPGVRVGIGVVQRAVFATTDTTNDQFFPVKERKHGIAPERLKSENVETVERTHMLALLYALALARETINQTKIPKVVQLQGVTIFSDSPEVVRTINHHIKHGLDSLRDVVSTNDRSMIGRVLNGFRKRSCHTSNIDIVSYRGRHKAGARAMVLARQGARQAYRGRRYHRKEREKLLQKQKKAAQGQGTFDLVIRTKAP